MADQSPKNTPERTTRVPIVTYLATLTVPRLVLWCYLIWWLFTVTRYFDPSLRLWLSSLGLSAIIGTALYLSTAYGSAQKTRLERWQIVRLYMMPLCVSSFSAIIKDKGFVLVFHPTLAANVAGLVLCLGFCGLVFVARQVDNVLRGTNGIANDV